jgi:hypothetical protein
MKYYFMSFSKMNFQYKDVRIEFSETVVLQHPFKSISFMNELGKNRNLIFRLISFQEITKDEATLYLKLNPSENE